MCEFRFRNLSQLHKRKGYCNWPRGSYEKNCVIVVIFGNTSVLFLPFDCDVLKRTVNSSLKINNNMIRSRNKKPQNKNCPNCDTEKAKIEFDAARKKEEKSFQFRKGNLLRYIKAVTILF